MNSRGATLIEMMVLIVVIGLIAAIVSKGCSGCGGGSGDGPVGLPSAAPVVDRHESDSKEFTVVIRYGTYRVDNEQIEATALMNQLDELKEEYPDLLVRLVDDNGENGKYDFLERFLTSRDINYTIID